MMMQTKRVRCPYCDGLLSLPEHLRGTLVRCGRCRRVFRLPQESIVPDETIFGWLTEPSEQQDKRADTLAPFTVDGKRHKTGLEQLTESGNKTRDAAPRAGKTRSQLRLLSLDQRGALLEFPAHYLRRADFRSAIPRVCIHCLGQVHLSAHLIIFAQELHDSFSLEAEYRAGKLTIPHEQLSDLYGDKLLQELPEVPNVPPPANLPMPYWLCDMCSGAGEISGQIRVDPATGEGTCRLFIRNIQIAASFFATIAGTEDEDYKKFVEFARHSQQDRWGALQTVVRHRLEQWFKPTSDERFLAYIPDQSRARTESGIAGLIITTRRLIYRRPPILQELSIDSPVNIEIRSQLSGKGKSASISAPNFKPRLISIDRKGEMALRRALSEAHFKATWQ